MQHGQLQRLLNRLAIAEEQLRVENQRSVQAVKNAQLWQKEIQSINEDIERLKR